MKEKDKFGDTDGTFFHERIFSCPADKGLFVSIDKLKTKLGESFMLEYAKQAAYGLAPSRTFKITFVGPEGSGKTSSIRTLLGEVFNPHESSTIGAILGIQAIIKWFMGNTNTEDEQAFKVQLSYGIGWKAASVVDMQQIRDKEFNREMFSTDLFIQNSDTAKPVGQLVENDTNSDTTEQVDQQEESDKNSDTVEQVVQQEENDDKCTYRQSNAEMSSKLASNNSEHDSKFIDPNSHTTEPIIMEELNDENADNLKLDNVEKEIGIEEDSEQYVQAKNVVFGDKANKLDSHACISDFAGQLTFFSFQLFFLKKRDTVVITFNASLKLTAKVIPRERYDYAKKKRAAAGMMTIIESIEFWLQSVSAHAGTSDVPIGCISRRSPTAILCATHAEKLTVAKMTFVAKYIFDHLSGKPYVDHLPTDPEKAIIFISNKNRKKFKHNIIKMQQVLLEAGQPTFNEERPISYLKLEQSIAIKVKEGVSMISVEEFTKLVNKAGIPGEKSSEAVNVALQYCSTRGTILYFSELKILSEIVFISPDWLSSIFSKIITTHDLVPSKHPLHRAWTRYDTYAILEEEFLDHILQLASVSEHKEIIISLMKLFNLLAEIPRNTRFINELTPPPQTGKKVYIVPALLLHNPDHSLCTHEKPDQMYLFCFSEKYFPESAFNQILVKMIGWSVQKKYQISR